jgi:carboxymethylenebutenolidase
MDGLTDKEFKGGVSRRGLVVGSLGVGFALSVQPVMAQNVITTSTDGLEAGEVKIKTADIEIPAYRAMPKTGTNFPTVLVVQEIWGVHEYIKDVCRRLAKAGYFAIAPELYVRQGDPMKAPDVPTIVREIMNKVPDKQVMADLDATVAYAKGTGKADTAKLGITGFCWGGRMVWLYAAHNPNLKAAVVWYGRVAGQPSEMNPKHPIDLVPQMNAAVLGLYGGADTGIPIETVQQMEKALSAAGKKHKFVVYPTAGHAFHADYRPTYVKAAADDGWTQALAWFKANGVG